MYENEYMYAIERDPEYLAHYGIKGMKWGVRKAIERGNQRALGRQYRKAQKKLAKLEKRAANGAKYARRAARLGAGAAAAGGLAALGTSGVASGVAKAGVYGGKFVNKAGKGLVALGGTKRFRKGTLGSAMRTAGYNMQNASGSLAKGGVSAAGAINKWGRSTSIGDKLASGGHAAIRKGSFAIGRTGHGNKAIATATLNAHKGAGAATKLTNNQYARLGAGAVAAGLAGAAGYNAYRAATTKRAAKKAAQFRSEMNKAFNGTQYANGGNRQGKKRRRRG